MPLTGSDKEQSRKRYASRDTEQGFEIGTRQGTRKQSFSLAKPSTSIQQHLIMSTPIEEEEAKKRAEWRAEQIRQLRIDSRFSFPFGMRLPIATSISFVSGLVLGMSHGSQMAGFRFRAENAHRLPTTPTGWYLYHKSKNYNMALGGVKEGLKMGAKVSFWTAGFFSIEEMFDRYRGTKDFLNTVIASLSIAGGFSLWSMLPFHHSLLLYHVRS